MILLLTLIGRFADDTASLMTPQTSLSDVLVSRPRRACYSRSSLGFRGSSLGFRGSSLESRALLLESRGLLLNIRALLLRIGALPLRIRPFQHAG